MNKKPTLKPTLSERLKEAKVVRREAKVIRERERAERDRLRNRKTEAKIKVREKKGGAGMQLLFFRRGRRK